MKNIPLPPTSHQPKKYAGPSADEVLALRKQFMNPGIFLYYKKPLMVVEGSMQYVWDDAGKRYLDGLGGIVTISVGHCHPHVIAAGNKIGGYGGGRNAVALKRELLAREGVSTLR